MNEEEKRISKVGNIRRYPEENKEIKLSEEEIDLIFKGIRPENMGYEEFKNHRKGLKRFITKYTKEGRMWFLSSSIEDGIRKTKTFYKKDLEK